MFHHVLNVASCFCVRGSNTPHSPPSTQYSSCCGPRLGSSRCHTVGLRERCLGAGRWFLAGSGVGSPASVRAVNSHPPLPCLVSGGKARARSNFTYARYCLRPIYLCAPQTPQLTPSSSCAPTSVTSPSRWVSGASEFCFCLAPSRRNM
jgi:hypothetical protein